MSSEKNTALLRKIMFPFEEHVEFLKSENMDIENIITIIKIVKRYFYSGDQPHDYGLYAADLDFMKMEVDTHYNIDKYPEYWI